MTDRENEGSGGAEVVEQATQGAVVDVPEVPAAPAPVSLASSGEAGGGEDGGGARPPPLSLEEIERIAHEPEAVLRNLLITRAYHLLSRDLANVINHQNVNWSTFATWASLTAGQSIRNEEIPRFVAKVLNVEKSLALHLVPWLHRTLGRLGVIRCVYDAVAGMLREVSSQVAEGNLKVFAELAPLFSEFSELLRSGATDQELEEFLERLRPGDVAQGKDGQALLRAAFTNYRAATQAATEDERLELILLANCRIGLHEQTRLQPNIKNAMDAPVDVLFGRHLKRAMPRWIQGPCAFAIKLLVRSFHKELTERWQEMVTRYVMKLTVPGGKWISLGDDVPELPVPEELEQIDLPELRELFAKYRGVQSLSVGSAARNWSELDCRMRFILELFRSRQQELDLFEYPFKSDAELYLAQGRVPPRALIA